MAENYSEDLAVAFGYMTIAEVRALKRLAFFCEVADPVFVNIGAGTGTSSLALREARGDAQLTSIDVSPGGPLGGLEGERNSFDNAEQKYPIQILAQSHDAARDWPEDLKIDLIFIDDGHQEPDIRGDIVGWLPHMNQDSIMAFHDYTTAQWPDVKKVVDELMEPYEKIALTDHVIAFRIRFRGDKR
jgi:precorrin-6B methylase 2